MQPVHAQRVGRDFIVIYESQGIYRVSATALLKTAISKAEEWTTNNTLPSWALTALLSYGLSRQNLGNKQIDTVLAARVENVLSEILDRALSRGDQQAESLATLALKDWQSVWGEFTAGIKAV